MAYNVSFYNRLGHTYHDSYDSVKELQDRLAYLEGREAETVRVAPTDSGLIRNTRHAEIAALRVIYNIR
jgi:hypothetical protein